ncbi:DJ-1/PfpI family protein [Caldichromatium japonicum]|uniref:DJ-1/PfpI family protein n=1 Tax=Caldichromatium japonicum TaxID=2699430 RepID=A0A6G7V9T1_9GAMM|nr:DJ-1 family glyoxalase III [Caldichromatium japonicum]QIK36819.1 DJ-1/PfpI family protein [Caldichromatium japonicum]
MRVLVPLAQGFEELEAVTVIDLLRRAEIKVLVAGLMEGPVKSSHGVAILPDTTLDAVKDQDFAMVVLPGGLPGAQHLENDPRVREILRRHAERGAYTAAICAAPKVLASAGLLDGRQATCYPGCVRPEDFPRLRLIDQPVVVDGQVVTGRGPGAAMDFALTLIESLAGRERREAVESALLRTR